MKLEEHTRNIMNAFGNLVNRLMSFAEYLLSERDEYQFII